MSSVRKNYQIHGSNEIEIEISRLKDSDENTFDIVKIYAISTDSLEKDSIVKFYGETNKEMKIQISCKKIT
jgi:hypothetical protein